MFHYNEPSLRMHLDDAQTIFFKRQLEEIDGQLYDIKYAKLEALELVSPKPLNPGANTYTYRMFDHRGMAVMTANYADGSPRSDVNGTETTVPVFPVRASFGYNVQEIRAAALAGQPLDAMKAMSCRRSINEKLNLVALLGDAEWGLIGLFNQASTNAYTVPATGTGSSKLWSTKTADQVLTDLFGIVDLIPTNTKEVENAKRLLMPYSLLRLINRMRVSTVSDTTVLQFFKMQRPNIEVRGALYLDTAGASGVSRIMAYDPDRVNLEWLLPVPFESFPPQLKGLEYVIECHARVGGVVVRYPLTICYADGC